MAVISGLPAGSARVIVWTMNSVHKLEFVLSGKRDGVDITPFTIGLNRFNEFNQQVAAFISGSSKAPLDDVHVRIEEGSYKLTTTLSSLLLASVEPDLQTLQRQDSLGDIDSKRAEVVAKWQAQSKRSPDISITIQPIDIPSLPLVQLTYKTDYRVDDITPWVRVEKYLFGTVEDMGGATRANLHLRIEGIKDQVKMAADQSYLKDQKRNRLYHPVLVRIEAQQHYKTGKLRNLRLLSFEDHELKYDEAALEQFTKAGRLAWAEVPDAAAWVREQRGGE